MTCKYDKLLHCGYLYRTGKGKWDTNNPCYTCQVFICSGQVVFTKNGEVKNVSFGESLKQRAQDQPKSMSLADVPEQIEVLLKDAKFKTDSRGQECAYLYLVTKNNLQIIQKYPPSSFAELDAALTKAGGFEHLKVTMTPWKKQILGKLQYPRLVPLLVKKGKE